MKSHLHSDETEKIPLNVQDEVDVVTFLSRLWSGIYPTYQTPTTVEYCRDFNLGYPLMNTNSLKYETRILRQVKVK